jgi:hypothetical protein
VKNTLQNLSQDPEESDYFFELIQTEIEQRYIDFTHHNSLDSVSEL